MTAPRFTVWENHFATPRTWQVWDGLSLLDEYADREIAERYAAYMNDPPAGVTVAGGAS
jgi:hypothetical protein